MGKAKTYQDNVRQENLLYFDEKYRLTDGFKEGINSLFASYSSNGGTFSDINLRAQPRLTNRMRAETDSKVYAELAKMDEEASSDFSKKIFDFVRRYHLSSEWVLPLIDLVIIGTFDVPDTRYAIRYDEILPDEVSIRVNQRTTIKDLTHALHDAQKPLPKLSGKRSYAGAYDPTEDPDFIDAVKKTSLDFLNEDQVSDYEKRLFFDPEDLIESAKLIYKNRKQQKDAGARGTATPPKFAKSMSDKKYFSSTLKGVAVQKAVERLKKQRPRFQQKKVADK